MDLLDALAASRKETSSLQDYLSSIMDEKQFNIQPALTLLITSLMKNNNPQTERHDTTTRSTSVKNAAALLVDLCKKEGFKDSLTNLDVERIKKALNTDPHLSADQLLVLITHNATSAETKDETKSENSGRQELISEYECQQQDTATLNRMFQTLSERQKTIFLQQPSTEVNAFIAAARFMSNNDNITIGGLYKIYMQDPLQWATLAASQYDPITTEQPNPSPPAEVTTQQNHVPMAQSEPIPIHPFRLAINDAPNRIQQQKELFEGLERHYQKSFANNSTKKLQYVETLLGKLNTDKAPLLTTELAKHFTVLTQNTGLGLRSRSQEIILQWLEKESKCSQTGFYFGNILGQMMQIHRNLLDKAAQAELREGILLGKNSHERSQFFTDKQNKLIENPPNNKPGNAS